MENKLWKNILVWVVVAIALAVALLALASPSFRQGADAVYQNF